MSPETQKLLTWVTGVIAAAIVRYAPGVPPDIANLIGAGIIGAVTGYVKQHWAEREQLCPKCVAERVAKKE